MYVNIAMKSSEFHSLIHALLNRKLYHDEPLCSLSGSGRVLGPYMDLETVGWYRSVQYITPPSEKHREVFVRSMLGKNGTYLVGVWHFRAETVTAHNCW